MRITREVDYAFRIAGLLALHEGEIVGAPTIAEIQCISERFTLRILRKLNMAGITEAKRGANGGYKLKKTKEDISLYDIIVAVDGPIEVNQCLSQDNPCCNRMNGRFNECGFHNKLAEVQFYLIKTFKESTLDQFIEK